MAETKLKLQSYGSQFYAPEGFLLNGKIVPSVASNNLTVAIKNLAGNDPSSADPVFVRLGDTVRTITGSLSITLNAGTNWFNSGSSELATKEIDYFVYLGYETDETAVRIGFGRIPYANRQDDYNSTNTNERHVAFNDALDSGNLVTVIGRFAATLSATASFNWSVPTFTATNLIQKPIYETRWLEYVPVVASAMTIVITGYQITQYKIISDKTTLNVRLEMTTSVTAAGFINCTTPIAAASAQKVGTLACSRIFDGGDRAGAVSDTGVANTFTVVRYDGSNWNLGAAKYFMVNGDYQL
jgi:hypothetical protein